MTFQWSPRLVSRERATLELDARLQSVMFQWSPRLVSRERAACRLFLSKMVCCFNGAPDWYLGKAFSKEYFTLSYKVSMEPQIGI